MNKKYLISLIIIIIIFLGGVFIWKVTKHTEQTKTISVTKKVKPLPKEVTVTLDKKGFSPQTVKINAGSAVRWKNESGTEQTVNSDNYPSNQLHKELNFGVFTNGSTVVYTFTKPGIYGYHNQFHHEQEGKVIVTN